MLYEATGPILDNRLRLAIPVQLISLHLFTELSLIFSELRYGVTKLIIVLQHFSNIIYLTCAQNTKERGKIIEGRVIVIPSPPWDRETI